MSGIQPVIIKDEDGRMMRGYIDLNSVGLETRDDAEVYTYTVTAFHPSHFDNAGGKP